MKDIEYPRLRSPKYYFGKGQVARMCKASKPNVQSDKQGGYVPTLNVSVPGLPTATTIHMPDIIPKNQKK